MEGRAVAARFVAATGRFDFRYRPDRSVRAPTEIFVSPLHYPHGYRVRVDGGRLVRRTTSHLAVRATSGRVVTVRVIPRTK